MEGYLTIQCLRLQQDMSMALAHGCLTSNSSILAISVSVDWRPRLLGVEQWCRLVELIDSELTTGHRVLEINVLGVVYPTMLLCEHCDFL